MSQKTSAASPVQGAASASGEAKGAAVKRWPFVETPGEFAERLAAATMTFGGDMLAAVRNVLIENPPALAERAQAWPSGAVPEGWTLEWDKWSAPGTIRLHSEKWGGCFLGEPSPNDIALPALAYRFLSEMLATPAPEQEAAQVGANPGAPAGLPDLSYDMLPPDLMQRNIVARIQERCAHEYLTSSSFGGELCSKCGKAKPAPSAAPVAQEAEQPEGDVMRPFGAPAGQHKAGEAAPIDNRLPYHIIDNSGVDDCICSSHATIEEAEAERMKNAQKWKREKFAIMRTGGGLVRDFAGFEQLEQAELESRVIAFSCKMRACFPDDPENQCPKWCGIEKTCAIAVRPKQSAASGSREGRDGCNESVNLGAANTNKGGE